MLQIETQQDRDWFNAQEEALAYIKNPRFRTYLREALEEAYAGNVRKLKLATQLHQRFPVPVEEFLLSEEYLNASEALWPKVLEELIELNSGEYVEAVLTGSIGCAKTTIALYTNAYQLYYLSCLVNPHKLYALDATSEIEFIFQSMTATLARTVDFERFKNIIKRSDYFDKFFPYDTNYESKLKFPKNIVVTPVSGSAMAAIGQNVMGGLIDEMNFMAIVEKSRQSTDLETYNQAEAIYDNISRRRKSRFMQQGTLPGILCLVSSKRYPGQFTDRKIEEAKNDSTIFVYDKRAWDVKPLGTYLGTFFNVFVGNEQQRPYIMEDGSSNPVLADGTQADDSMILPVPTEHRVDFERDIMGALRDIGGMSTIARHPFITDPSIIRRAMRIPSIFSHEAVDFQRVALQVYPKRFVNPHLPRYVHMDLAVSGDSAGVAIGHCSGFLKLDRGSGVTELLPQIYIDGVLEIKPPIGGEILFWKIRDLLYLLRDTLKMNIRWVSCDTYQSRDTIQILRTKGFVTGFLSLDKNTTPYDVTKWAFADDRINMPFHKKTLVEFGSLEKDVEDGTIDHPPSGSKDCSDAVGGVVYGLTIQRTIWAQYKVPVSQIPPSLVLRLKDEKKEEKEDQGVKTRREIRTERDPTLSEFSTRE